jgi:hypothetical protein
VLEDEVKPNNIRKNCDLIFVVRGRVELRFEAATVSDTANCYALTINEDGFFDLKSIN